MFVQNTSSSAIVGFPAGAGVEEIQGFEVGDGSVAGKLQLSKAQIPIVGDGGAAGRAGAVEARVAAVIVGDGDAAGARIVAEVCVAVVGDAGDAAGVGVDDFECAGKGAHGHGVQDLACADAVTEVEPAAGDGGAAGIGIGPRQCQAAGSGLDQRAAGAAVRNDPADRGRQAVTADGERFRAQLQPARAFERAGGRSGRCQVRS